MKKIDKKTVVILLIAIVIVFGLVLMLSKQNQQAVAPADSTSMARFDRVATPTSSSLAINSSPSATSSSSSPSATPTSSQAADTDKISYSDGKFTPSTTSINIGQSIVFYNDSYVNVSIVSNPAPLNNGYPALNLGIISPKTYSKSLQFNTAGSYGYYNLLDASQTGTIEVKNNNLGNRGL